MVPSLLASSSFLLASHSTVGCSTGYMTGLREDWPALVDEAARTSSFAIELSALSECELPGLVRYLQDAPQLPFRFVSVHAPSKGREMTDADLVGVLGRLPRWVSAIVMHPDAMGDVASYRALGRRLSIENMDARKAIGQTAADLDPYFAVLPDARLCFDIAHAKAVDPTLDAGREMLVRFASRLSHVHLSSLDEHQRHVPLTDEDQALFSGLLSRCTDVPWILEAPPL
jgi:hypothetical protein